MHSLTLSWGNLLNPFIDGLDFVLKRLPSALLLLIIGAIVIQIAVRLTRVLMALIGVQTILRQVLGSIIDTILWIILIIQLLGQFGLGGIITFFASSVLALGLVMAAGGSTLVADIIGGLLLAYDNDFGVGDEVRVGEGPTQGVVVGMDARRVRLRGEDGELHVIPNSVVERKEWVLVKRHPRPGRLNLVAEKARRLSSVTGQRAADAGRQDNQAETEAAK